MVKLDITTVLETEILGASPSMPTNMTQSEKQAERGKLSPPRYDRKFARNQWRKDLSSMFLFRGRMPSCPSFHDYTRGAKVAKNTFSAKTINDTVP